MKASNYLAKLPQETTIKNIEVRRGYDLITLDIGSKAFSGVSPQFPGVLYCFTSLFRRTPCFPGVPLNLLVFLVFTRFHWSSPLFTGVPYLNHQIFLKLHQVFLKLLIALIAMLDASIVVPAIQ